MRAPHYFITFGLSGWTASCNHPSECDWYRARLRYRAVAEHLAIKHLRDAHAVTE